MVSEMDFIYDFGRIKKVIDTLFTDEQYIPVFDGWSNEFNPTRDPPKNKMLRIERQWDWRDRVFKSLMNQAELPNHLRCRYRWYLTITEEWVFWEYYRKGVWRPECGRAIVKVCRNFDRWKVWE